MKISNSKKELAKIISENGGWHDGADLAWLQDRNLEEEINEVWFGTNDADPEYIAGTGFASYQPYVVGKFTSFKFKNFHQAILSRAEYFHLYQAPDADGWIEWNGGEIDIDDMQLVDYRMACTPDGKHRTSESMSLVWDKHGEPQDIIAYRLHKPEQAKSTAVGDDETNLAAKEELEAMELSESAEVRANLARIYAPSIESLATDYRNKLDDADRKQDEADKAKLESDAALSELEEAIAAIGFAITPIGADAKEPELVITDWRDLQIGDVIFVDGYDLHEAGEGEVINMENPGYGCDYAVKVMTSGGAERWIDVNEMWRFVRRPAK